MGVSSSVGGAVTIRGISTLSAAFIILVFRVDAELSGLCSIAPLQKSKKKSKKNNKTTQTWQGKRKQSLKTATFSLEQPHLKPLKTTLAAWWRKEKKKSEKKKEKSTLTQKKCASKKYGWQHLDECENCKLFQEENRLKTKLHSFLIYMITNGNSSLAFPFFFHCFEFSAWKKLGSITSLVCCTSAPLVT